MGLIITRRLDEEFVLYAKPGADAEQLAELLTEGITVRLHKLDHCKAWLDITAPDEIAIARSELLET